MYIYIYIYISLCIIPLSPTIFLYPVISSHIPLIDISTVYIYIYIIYIYIQYYPIIPVNLFVFPFFSSLPQYIPTISIDSSHEHPWINATQNHRVENHGKPNKNDGNDGIHQDPKRNLSKKTEKTHDPSRSSGPAHLGQPSQRDRQAVLDGPQATSHPMRPGEAHHTVAWPQRLHRKSAEFPRNWWLLTRNDRLRWFNESSCVDSEMLVLATTVFFHQNAGEYVFCIQKRVGNGKVGSQTIEEAGKRHY